MKSTSAVPDSTARPSRHAAPAGMGGVTLIELLVTVLIAALIITLGAPSLLRMLARHAILAQAEELQDAVRVGRNEAMKRSGPVVLCRTDASSPSRCAGSGGSWQTWLLFADVARTGAFGGADALVRQHLDVSNRMTIVSNAPSIRFESTGIAHSDAGATVFLLSPAGSGGGDGVLQRQVCVNPRGDVVVIAGDATCP